MGFDPQRLCIRDPSRINPIIAEVVPLTPSRCTRIHRRCTRRVPRVVSDPHEDPARMDPTFIPVHLDVDGRSRGDAIRSSSPSYRGSIEDDSEHGPLCRSASHPMSPIRTKMRRDRIRLGSRYIPMSIRYECAMYRLVHRPGFDPAPTRDVVHFVVTKGAVRHEPGCTPS